jgi:hypothetical protein
MRPGFAIWALGSLAIALLWWLNAPLLYWFVFILVYTAIEWGAKRWIARRQAARGEPAGQDQSEPTPLMPNRLMTGVFGAVLGALVGVAIGFTMQSNASTMQ